MDLSARARELAQLRSSGVPVVSVYLDTRWTDEHQRERVRIFLKNRVAQAQADGRAAASDLDWIRAEAEALIGQAHSAPASGAALFACEPLGLRRILTVRTAFEDTFVVAETPYLRPLVAAARTAVSAMVVFVDATRARLIPLTAEGPGEEALLQHEVPGHHRRGGWAQLAQSRYQRHIQDHRDRHLEAVAEAVREIVAEMPEARIVLAGEPRLLAVFRERLPRDLADRTIGTIAGSQHEAASALLERASSLLALRRGNDLAAEVDRLLVEAEKGGRAVAGLGAVLHAATRGAIQRLYVLGGVSVLGRLCSGCGGLQVGPEAGCRQCGNPTGETELGEAVVGRVLGDGGTVEIVDAHAGLAGRDGMAALLRYPL